jgi:hypothetical protein
VGDPSWLEALMDQPNFDSLADGVVSAKRGMRQAAKQLEQVVEEIAKLPPAKTEDDLAKEIGEALECRRSSQRAA